MRTIIIGPPKSGKTTLTLTYDCEKIHGDDFISLGWSEASQAIADLLDGKPEDSNYVAEGVVMARALRKMLTESPYRKPCCKVIYLEEPYVELTKGQIAMGKGLLTVWNGIEPKLVEMGVEIEFRKRTCNA